MSAVLVAATLILTTVAGLQRASDFHRNAADERDRYLENEREKIRAMGRPFPSGAGHGPEYVGTGVSIDAIDEILASKRSAYLWMQLYAALAGIGILVLLLFFARFTLFRFFARVETNLSRLTTFLKKNVHGIALAISQDLSFFEFQRIAADVETMVQQREAVQKELQTEQKRLAGILRGTNAGTWELNIQTG